jgi:hypothetical protein
MLKMKDMDQFLERYQRSPIDLEGHVIELESDPETLILVGTHDYAKVDMKSFPDLKTFKDNLAAKDAEINQLKNACAELKERLQSKYQIRDKQVLHALRYSVTKFALLVRASENKKEMIETINKGVNDLLLFAENLGPEEEIKKLLDKKGLESAQTI